MSEHVSIQVEDNLLLISSILKESDKIFLTSFHKIDRIDLASTCSSLDSLFRTNHWDRHSVIISIPSERCILRKFEVPFTNTFQIGQIIKYETEQHIAFGSIEELIIDYLVISQTDKSTRLLVAAVPKTILADLLALFESAFIYPSAIELDAIALFHASKYCGNIASSKSSLLVYVHDNGFSSIWLSNNSIKDFRSVRLGVSSIIDGFRSDINDTAELPLNYNVPRIFSASYLEKFFSRFAKELRRTMLNIDSLDNIYLCGNSLLISQLPDYLESKHNISASLWDISSLIQTKDCNLPTEFAYSLIPVGLALKEPSHGFNFRKDIFHYDKSFDLIKLQLSIFLTLLFLLTSFFLFFSCSHLNKQIKEYDSILQIAESIYKSSGFDHELNSSKWDKIYSIRSIFEQDDFTDPTPQILDSFTIWSGAFEHLAKARKLHPFIIDSLSIDQFFLVFSGKSQHDVVLDVIKQYLVQSPLTNGNPNSFHVLSTQSVNDNSTSTFPRQFKCQIKLKANQ